MHHPSLLLLTWSDKLISPDLSRRPHRKPCSCTKTPQKLAPCGPIAMSKLYKPTPLSSRSSPSLLRLNLPHSWHDITGAAPPSNTPTGWSEAENEREERGSLEEEKTRRATHRKLAKRVKNRSRRLDKEMKDGRV